MSSARSETPSIGDIDASVIHHIRDDATSPTPTNPTSIRSPASASSTSQSRPKWPRSSSSHASRSRSHHRASEILTMVIAEEERQTNTLRSALDSTNERVEYEMRRADVAELRAEQATGRARDAYARAAGMATAKHQAEIELTRAQEEIKRFRAQLETAHRELRRAQGEIDTLEQQRIDAEESAVNARETARQLRLALEVQKAREAGWREGRRTGIEETMDGFADGQSEALDEGVRRGKQDLSQTKRDAFNRGRQRGYEEGISEGIASERENALAQFDRYLADQERDQPVAANYDEQDSLKSFVRSPPLSYRPSAFDLFSRILAAVPEERAGSGDAEEGDCLAEDS